MEKEAHIIKEEIITKQAILLDVREVNEWQDGHFVQAKSYPLSLLLNKIPDDIDPNTHIYIHCAHGRRAEHAMKILLPFRHLN